MPELKRSEREARRSSASIENGKNEWATCQHVRDELYFKYKRSM